VVYPEWNADSRSSILGFFYPFARRRAPLAPAAFADFFLVRHRLRRPAGNETVVNFGTLSMRRRH
jgi:hypothetical protein